MAEELPGRFDQPVAFAVSTGQEKEEGIVGKFSDRWPYESTVRFRPYRGVLSVILAQRLQAYEYFTVIPNRYAFSLSVINGTGCALPAGY